MVFSKDELHCDVLPQYCLFNGSLLSHASCQTFLMYYFFSAMVGIVLGPSIFVVSRFQS